MIARLAVVPHPLILVPELLAARAAGETAVLRDACLLAVRAVGIARWEAAMPDAVP